MTYLQHNVAELVKGYKELLPNRYRNFHSEGSSASTCTLSVGDFMNAPHATAIILADALYPAVSCKIDNLICKRRIRNLILIESTSIISFKLLSTPQLVLETRTFQIV